MLAHTVVSHNAGIKYWLYSPLSYDVYPIIITYMAMAYRKIHFMHHWTARGTGYWGIMPRGHRKRLGKHIAGPMRQGWGETMSLLSLWCRDVVVPAACTKPPHLLKTSAKKLRGPRWSFSATPARPGWWAMSPSVQPDSWPHWTMRSLNQRCVANRGRERAVACL